MKTAIDTADELATKYAQCIWWTRIPILSRRDPRLGEGKTAPAAWCELCEEVYAELPNNKSPYISAAEAAPAHIKDAHPAYWDAFIDQAYLAIRAADQIKDEASLTFSRDVVDACILRMAEHLMRHSEDKLRAL